MQGTVKFFNHEQGYGFITPDDGSADVLLKASELQKSGLDDVEDGSKLEFETQNADDGKGRIAINIAVDF